MYTSLLELEQIVCVYLYFVPIVTPIPAAGISADICVL
jgi:hypothetical protein